MSRASVEDYAARLAETEQAMIRLRSSFRVEQALCSKYGVSPRNVRRWMHQVRKKWKVEAAGEELDRTNQRQDMHSTLNEILFQALNRTQVVKDANGDPILDPASIVRDVAGNPVLDANGRMSGRPMVKANPDLQRALHACIQIRGLHALDEPTKNKVEIDLSKDLKQLPDLGALKPDSVEMLRALIKSVAPDGDLKQLAGDWYKSMGDDKE